MKPIITIHAGEYLAESPTRAYESVTSYYKLSGIYHYGEIFSINRNTANDTLA